MFSKGLGAVGAVVGRASGSAKVSPGQGDDGQAPVEPIDPEIGGDDGPHKPRGSGESSAAGGGGWAGKAMGVAGMAGGIAGTAAKAAAEAGAPMAKDAAVRAAEAAKLAAETAQPYATEAAIQAKHAAEQGAEMAQEAAELAAEKAKEAAIAAKKWAQEKLEEFKRMLEIWVKQKLHMIAAMALDKVPPAVKGALEDEDMPRCVSKSKDKIVDAMWPHIREEILWELAVMMDGSPADPESNEETRRGVDCIRAFFRYHLFPYDRTIWRQFRDPVFWAFTLFSAVPVHGISPFVFFCIFLLIDKSDEWQLLQFILSFKGMQFITQGIIRSISGYFAFVGCVTAPAKSNGHSCHKQGPGVYGDIGILGLVGYVTTCILVWISFALLRCSKEKGRSTLNSSLAAAHHSSLVHKPGGMIRYFVWWDIFVFVLCVGVVCWAASTRPTFSYSDWAIGHVIFAAQIVHGLLSAPFFFFTLPGLSRVLAHALPTAYDRKGRCRPPIKPPTMEEERKKFMAQPRQELLTEGESADLWSRIRTKSGIANMPMFD